MPTPLLVTKLHIPKNPHKLVDRPLIMSKLNEGIKGNLTLVSAPAGFGKSTLISSWLSNGAHATNTDHTAWLSLDKNDNDIIRFYRYFFQAIQEIDVSLGKVSDLTLKSTKNPATELILTSLINEMVDFEKPIIIILDDYHEITNSEIHNAIEFMLENFPQNAHLIILTREDPPISLSRLRVRGALTEIRANDLRFSKEETSQFFNQVLAYSLKESDIQGLHTRTEGWVAGLQLAALSLNNAKNQEAFIHSFTGSHRFLTEYLIDEVLRHQPEHLQQFLQFTSILDRFCPDLCDEVIGIQNSKQILAQLEKENLFLVPLDDNHNWFRYHHLFAEFLQVRLKENEPKVIASLYQKSINWLSRNGYKHDALLYALKAQAFELASTLIRDLAPEVLEKDDHRQVINWINSLPKQIAEQDPYICVYMAWALVMAAKMESASAWLDFASQNLNRLEDNQQRAIQGHIAAHQAYITLLQGQYKETINLAEKAIAFIPQHHTESILIARVNTCMGIALSYCGKIQEAKEKLKSAINYAKKANSLPLANFSYGGLGEVYRDEGRLSDAANTYQELLQFVERLAGKSDVPLAGFAHIQNGVIKRERNMLNTALEDIKKGVEHCRAWQQGEPLGVGLLELAETYRLMGDLSSAEKTLDEVRLLAEEISSWAIALVEAFTVRILISAGDFTKAKHILQQNNLLNNNCELGYERYTEYYSLILYYLKTNHSAEALAITKSLLQRDLPLNRKGLVLDLLVFQAVANANLGNAKQAQENLENAFLIAEPEMWIRPFLDHCETLLPLLQKLSVSTFKNKLLTTFGKTQELGQTTSKTQNAALIEPLNEREIQVLKLIASGLSNKEIGEILFISVNTVRWYASQLYEKLAVKSRSEAAAKARTLGIIK